MNKYALFTVGGIIFIGVLFVVFAGRKHVTNYPSKGVDIIAFGDSLIEGVGASSPGNTFISILSNKIDRPIINLGVSGNTTLDGLKRINEIDSYNPKVVILLLGGNDYLKKVSDTETFNNLEKIIQHIQSKGSVVVLLGIRGGLFRDNFENKFEEISDKYRTAYVPDVLDGLFTNNKYMSDAVHPNDEGYKLIADKVYKVLEEVLN